jgi:hypothetical protein
VFFAECSIRGKWRGESKAALKQVVSILEAAQQADGGWGHGLVQETESSTEEERPGFRRVSGYPATLLASTNTVASALGIIEATLGRGTVSGLDRARKHYHEARHDDGSYPYDRRQRGRHGGYTGAARTGGALLAMHFLGVPRSDPDFAGSVKHVRLRLEYASEGHGSSMLNLAQTALAMKVLGEDDWAMFRAEFFPRILARQAEDGSLRCICEDKAFGTTCDDPRPGVPGVFERTERAYVTSLLTLVLLLDENRPEFLEKKPVPAPARGEATPRKR